MRQLILVRHAHAASNADDVVSCTPPGGGLSTVGVEQAGSLRALLDEEPIDLGVCSELRRTRETLSLALGDREVARLELPAWNEIHFGAYEGGPLADYRAWAWSNEADAPCPGDGETRAAVVLRVAGVLRLLLGRAEHTVLAVGHALPVRYVLDAAEGRTPQPRITPVAHAAPHRLTDRQVETAAEVLRSWAAAPSFASRSQP
jgi:broad specificity phosphatase PhoE